MSYVLGCVLPIEAGKRDRFVEQAVQAAPFFREFGASSVLDAVGDDVPKGEATDFRRAVDAKDGELVAFGWVIWPDKATKNAAEPAMMSDPRMDMSDMAFDGKRMIYGGFEPMIDEGPGGAFGYIDGFVLAVPTARREEFVRHCREAAPLFLRNGATRHVECWGVDVPEGKVTDFHRAVKTQADETVCFAWIEWPDRETRDAGHEAVSAEMERIDIPMPFDAKRVIHGGFAVVSRES
ncbi:MULTISPECIES: DUF1428 domain-containing protein [unclassified Aureimonas]|uniref:DUF1428 domain-containing protein n=1 Tax=unclassified Aureimonas TaxID=2615206 RepID=UPI0009EBB634|nr:MULTISPECIES: DUF1428 domain-containing protein [unclassified Aureimonas]